MTCSGNEISLSETISELQINNEVLTNYVSQFNTD